MATALTLPAPGKVLVVDAGTVAFGATTVLVTVGATTVLFTVLATLAAGAATLLITGLATLVAVLVAAVVMINRRFRCKLLCQLPG